MAVNPGFTAWNGFQTAAVPGAVGAGFYGGFGPGYGYGYPVTTGYQVVTGNPTGGGLDGFYNGPPQLTTNTLSPLMNAIRSSARTGWSTPPW